ncbi:MAG: bifunctional phosphoribosylaminoimidazolecarboxamide formyltransferase/IMP cyclohydrolase [Candidatus Kariarchaeaceae archaeon]|jgi:phosphoribosylaminoimidazolecarboxamide formyltransferase/IMP cyclohydrolase
MKDKYALLSVSDKSGIIEIAQKISETHKIIATSGTAEKLRKSNLEVIEVSEYTQQTELFNGTIKTLHPKIYAGILFRDDPEDMQTMEEMGAGIIDIVICNLYGFGEMGSSPSGGRLTIDQVDIGGPAIIRASAKSFERVTIIVDPDDYSDLIPKLPNLDISDRIKLAAKAINLMANYDIDISKYMNKIAEVSTSFFNNPFSKNYFMSGTLGSKLRYGENPHQIASYYNSDEMAFFEYLEGPNISYNNILDINTGWELVIEFQDPTCAIIKHRTPCGVATSKDLVTSYKEALDTDKISAYGGVYVFNQTIDQATANELVKEFVDVVFAPGYDDGILEILKKKDDLTIIRKSQRPERRRDISLVAGGFVIQERDTSKLDSEQLEFVSRQLPNEQEIEELKFAWSVVKHTPSDGIVISDGMKTIGIGAGQTNRVAAVKQAIKNAGNKSGGAILASDGSFAFTDSIKLAGEAGIKLIVSPKGSKNDNEIINESNKQNIKLVFTKTRVFKH